MSVVVERPGRILVLTGLVASLIVSAFALFAHNRLYSNDLRRTSAAESALERRLRDALRPADTSGQRGAVDAAELALAHQPPVVGSLAGALFDAAELDDFEARRVRSPFEIPEKSAGLASPGELSGSYALGVVTLTWNPGSLNRVRAANLEREGSDLRLGQRVYRGVNGGELQQVATLPFGEAVWRDTQMPIAESRLAYQIWAVMLRHDGSGDVLVDAERSDVVTVTTPDHFTLSLVEGSGEQAVFLIQVNLPQAVGDRRVTARLGEEVKAGPATTGLFLKDLQTTRTDALTTQQHLLLTTDGSLVLDPDTHEPRTTQTQVLKPVTRLVATLATRDGAVRTLHVDLP
jgi:hypothetical protein